MKIRVQRGFRLEVHDERSKSSFVRSEQANFSPKNYLLACSNGRLRVLKNKHQLADDDKKLNLFGRRFVACTACIERNLWLFHLTRSLLLNLLLLSLRGKLKPAAEHILSANLLIGPPAHHSLPVHTAAPCILEVLGANLDCGARVFEAIGPDEEHALDDLEKLLLRFRYKEGDARENLRLPRTRLLGNLIESVAETSREDAFRDSFPFSLPIVESIAIYLLN